MVAAVAAEATATEKAVINTDAAAAATAQTVQVTKPAFVAKKVSAAGATNEVATPITAAAAAAAKASSSSRRQAIEASSTVAAAKTTKPAMTMAMTTKVQPSKQQKKKSKKKQQRQQQQILSPITERHERITAKEELELARIVRQGSELHRLKSAFESEHGRDITRQEWTDLAMTHKSDHKFVSIANPRDLRRLVSAYRSAKNQLVASNMGLVYAVVRSKHGHRLRMAGITEDELVQEGSLGLIRAAELFDPERGLRFSTYATVWIKGVLSNCQLDQTIAVPARERTKWNKIRRAAADLVLEGGGDPTTATAAAGVEEANTNARPKVGDVASRTGLGFDEVQGTTAKMAQVQKVLSLDYQYRTARRSGVEEHTGFEHDRAFQVDADLAERLNFKSDVIAALARNLSEEEGQLMRLRYGLDGEGNGEGRSLAECAKIMGWSRDKARLLANKCLKKLREADEAEALQEYLLTVA
mmetsp:Transcript_29585/g.86166  ORF Transcript_29585/g.86166 Transcript_29585/m.86166 type:complete len:472 (+) Transcript_29585:1152-2567(+)